MMFNLPTVARGAHVFVVLIALAALPVFTTSNTAYVS